MSGITRRSIIAGISAASVSTLARSAPDFTRYQEDSDDPEELVSERTAWMSTWMEEAEERSRARADAGPAAKYQAEVAHPLWLGKFAGDYPLLLSPR